MAFTMTLFYSKTTTLDLPYYFSHHWPLVNEKWGPHGFLDWKVVQFTQNPDGSETPYKIQALLFWRDEKSLISAKASEDWKAVMDDVPNFSNETPLVLEGAIIGSS
jgi:uncharacterized protein (TIGR02118 family)